MQRAWTPNRRFMKAYFFHAISPKRKTQPIVSHFHKQQTKTYVDLFFVLQK